MEVQTLKHSKWECNNHVVSIPKYRRKTIFSQQRPKLGEVFRELARRRQSKILEGYITH